MKKLVVLFFILFICLSVSFANNDRIEKSGKEDISYENNNLHNISISDQTKWNHGVPEWEWVTQPYSIMTSWYDYMPSSYESYPLRLQYNGDGGLYYTWHATPDDAGSNRRQYWAYMQADNGSLVDWGTISTQDVWQGYGSINVHPEFGGGIATWHQEDATLGYGTTMTYDSYIFSTPGFWTSYLFIPPEEPGVNEYIWPYVWVGPSPLSGHHRVYQTAKNYTHNASDFPCEDMRIMFCDVESTSNPDMSVLLDLANWTVKTPMYYWREKDCRPQSQCFTIDPNIPGHIVIIGFASWLSGDLGNMPVNPGMWMWESWDYGETWDQADLYCSDTPDDAFYQVENIPQMGGPPIPDYLDVSAGGWHNSARFDNEGNLHWSYLLQYGYTNDENESFYFPNFMPAAETIWDGETFTYDEIPEMPGYDSYSGHSVPWEIVGGDTITYPVVAWSTYEDELFHENVMKNAINFENGWMVQMWADGTYITLNSLGEPGYEDYATHPIIYISASMDNGEHWSEPIELTDIYNPEINFMDQITVYPYLCNEIVDLGDMWGQIHFSYYDDNSFGSFIYGGGQNLGGQIMYGSIEINFALPGPSINSHEEIISSIKLHNSPNPIANYTEIYFESPKEIYNSQIRIYNTKGQLIKNLIPNSDNKVTWNGKDNSNNDVSNGIYFYKLITKYGSVAEKMLLSR